MSKNKDKLLIAVDRSEEMLHDPNYVKEALDTLNDFVKNSEVTVIEVPEGEASIGE